MLLLEILRTKWEVYLSDYVSFIEMILIAESILNLINI